MERYDNKVIQQGRVLAVNIKQGEEIPKVCSITLETTSSKDNANRNQPMIMFFNDMVTEAMKYKSGDFVYIEGHLEPHSIKNENGKVTTTQSIVADMIKPAKSKLEDKYDIKSHHNLYEKLNEVFLAGVVIGVSDYGKNMKLIMLRTMFNGRVSRIMVRSYVFGHNKEYLDSLEIGNNVCVVGTIQTRKREMKNTRPKHFENVIAMEISKIE